MGLSNFSIEGRHFPLLRDPLKEWMWELFIPNIDSFKFDYSGNFAFTNFDDEDFIVRCRTAQIPSNGFETYESNFMGFKKIIPIKKKMTNVITTELEEFEDQKVFKFIYSWMNLIINQNMKDDNVGVSITEKYTRPIILKMYSMMGIPLNKNIKFYNAFPSNVSEVSLSYSGSGSVKYSVEWSFDYWVAESETESKISEVRDVSRV